MAAEDDQAVKSERWPMAKERGGKSSRRPKATFSILMAMYKEGSASVRGHEN
jgi:hypothetical protein